MESVKTQDLQDKSDIKILVVDDEKDIQTLFEQRFRREIKNKITEFAFAISGEEALTYLNQKELAPAAVDETLGVLLKYQDDIAKVRGAEAARLVNEVQQAAE